MLNDIKPCSDLCTVVVFWCNTQSWDRQHLFKKISASISRLSGVLLLWETLCPPQGQRHGQSDRCLARPHSLRAQVTSWSRIPPLFVLFLSLWWCTVNSTFDQSCVMIWHHFCSRQSSVGTMCFCLSTDHVVLCVKGSKGLVPIQYCWLLCKKTTSNASLTLCIQSFNLVVFKQELTWSINDCPVDVFCSLAFLPWRLS